MRPGRTLPAALLALVGLGSALRADDWPQWRGLNRDGVWNERGILEKIPAEGLKVRWRVPVGPGFSSPVIAQGRVFVIDCELGPKELQKAKERVHCIDESTGKPLWTHAYDVNYPSWAWPPDCIPGQGPTSTPIVQGGRVYSVGALGHLVCLDAFTGKRLWVRTLAQDYGVVEFSIRGSPLIEGDLLILQTGYNKPKVGVVAFEKETGKEAWKALDENEGGYCSSPLVVEAGGRRQLIVTSERGVAALDPATGRSLWTERFTSGIPTPVVSGNRLLVNGLMFALDAGKPAASVVWPARKPDAQLSDTTTAIFHGDLVFSHKKPDRLVCLEAATGRPLWETDQVKSSMHSLTRCGDGAFLFTDKGELIRVRLGAQGYEEAGRTALIKPTSKGAKDFVLYAAPAYANRRVFARNDEELVCASLAPEP